MIELSALFFCISMALFFGSAYVNHRIFKNSEGLLSLFLWCAAFTTTTEFVVFSAIKQTNLFLLTGCHLAIWSVWFAGMVIDNKIQSYIDKKIVKKEGTNA